jgi:hypothetical protein
MPLFGGEKVEGAGAVQQYMFVDHQGLAHLCGAGLFLPSGYHFEREGLEASCGEHAE